jgi:Na+-transporting methylmalonyl-CoA/oxaloacetate decarboxylase gamma subunit
MENIKGEMLPVGTAALDSVLGYAVVFIGLALLMLVIMLMGKIMVGNRKKSAEKTAASLADLAASTPAPTEPAIPAAERKLAPGSAGEIKLYDTDPRDAAMIMAIVADKMKKPLNELRFISIKEVK